MIDKDRALLQQALDALLLIDLKNLVPDYGSGHYSLARTDADEIEAAIEALLERLTASKFSPFLQKGV